MINPKKKLIIHGMVQGVGFRGYCVEKARELGIKKGHAVNHPISGTVEVIFEGSFTAANSFIQKLKEFPGVKKIDILDYEKEIDSSNLKHRFDF